jgi:ABC-type transport system involved in multi-copper enzyme maturation permease subunit
MTRFIRNPMILKELRQRLRERRAWLLPTLYLLTVSGTVCFAYYATTTMQPANRQHPLQGAEIGIALFLTAVVTQLVLLLLMAPIFSAGSLTIEKEQRTFAALLTSLLSAPQIWWGKFVAAFLYLLLLLFGALPLLAICFAFGGVEVRDLLQAVGSTILVLASISAVGLWCSSVFRRSVHSTAASYTIVLVLSIVTLVVFAVWSDHWQTATARFNQPYPTYIQAPLWLNPFYPFLSFLNGNGAEKLDSPLSSWLLYSAIGCLSAAFAIRNIQRAGEQL